MPVDNYMWWRGKQIGAALSGFPWSKNSYRYFTELRRITEESVVHDCKSLTVLFNSGIHDLFSSKFSLHKYSVGLNHSLIELKGLFADLQHRSRIACNQTLPKIKLFWVSTVPLFSKYRLEYNDITLYAVNYIMYVLLVFCMVFLL